MQSLDINQKYEFRSFQLCFNRCIRKAEDVVMRVLVADDHQLFIDGIALILNKLDAVMEISAATSAEQAIALLESGREFDLVLVDLGMPGMDGMSILRRMHERGVWLPLVVVSAEEDAHAIKSALDAGALGFIPKAHGSQQMLAAL
jgi:DNA-binding NarL/FixJ family response regulator